MHMKFSKLAFLLLFVFAACDDTIAPGDIRVTSATVDSAAGPIQRYLDVQLNGHAAVEVTYSAPGVETLRMIADSSARAHRVFLPRLRANLVYEYEVRPVPNNRIVGGSFGTGALPADVAELQFTHVTGTSTSPLYLIEIMITNNGFFGALIVDGEGRVVWYWRGTEWINGMDRRANGNFIALEEQAGLIELTPDLREVRRLPNGANQPWGQIHHDVIATPQNTVYFLARERTVIRDTTVVGEALWEWNPETGITNKRWVSFDHMDWDTERAPQSAPNNWLHSNSLHIGPRGNVVISHRNLDQVISIRSDFQELEWRLGGPGATITPAPEDRFFGQHSAQEVAPNRVLLFDNGFVRPNLEAWSRVMEFAIDPASGTATKVWEFRPSPDINAVRVGATNRLPNGNTTASFGWGQGFPIAIFELNQDQSVKFQLEASDMMNRMYRARPIMHVGGEEEVVD
jgi:hypothetical protein